MDDIMSMVGQIMADPEQIKQLSSLAASLGISTDESENKTAKQEPSPTSSAIASILGEENSLSTLLPLVQKLQESADDKYITFLRALQPLLSDSRKQKVDTAITLLKLLTFVPYLEESGILPENNLLNQISKFLKGVLS